MKGTSGIPLVETTVNGARSRRWMVEADACAGMNVHRMARVGIDQAMPDYRRVRMSPAGSFVLACVSGVGRVLLDGRWMEVGAGTVCLAPPRVLNAFYAVGSEPWVFGWVRYVEPSFVSPMVGAASPVTVKKGAGPLMRTLEGIREEWNGEREAAMVHHWLELLNGNVRRLSRPWGRSEPRMVKLWERVAREVERPWTLDELAHQCHCSAEHLRRLCVRELGRSPMQHLTCLRMEKARRLLEATPDKLEVVAESVGYANGAIFSRVFKRWVGVTPGEYRG